MVLTPYNFQEMEEWTNNIIGYMVRLLSAIKDPGNSLDYVFMQGAVE